MDWISVRENPPQLGDEIWVYDPREEKVIDFRYFGLAPLKFMGIELWQPKTNDKMPDSPEDNLR